MSAIKGPNIIKNGLVLALDAANAQSFKGEPTTNLAASGGLIGMSGITLTDLGLEDGWRKYGMSGTFTGGTYPYIMRISGYTFTGGVLYTSKCIVKTNVGFKFNYFGANGLSYVNEPMNNGGTLSSTQNSDGSYTIARIGFAYTNTTNQPGYLWTNPINNTSFNSSTDFVYIKELQVEQKAYATPFVNGTRGTTVATGGGWADQSGRNSNGSSINGPTFSNTNLGGVVFDGVDDYVNIPTFTDKPTSQITCDAWIRPTKASVGTGTIRGGAISATNSMYLGIINSIDGGNTFAMHWANQTSNSRLYNWNGSIPNNTWTYIAGTYDGSTSRAYVNGVQVDSWAQTGTIPDATYVIGTYGGGLTDSVHNFQGLIAIARIYNRGLSAAEVLQNYNVTKRRFGL
jgi:hypothetical protein